VSEGQIFYLDAPFDALSPIGSIMEIHEAHQEGDRPMQVQFSGQKILIFLSKKDFADYKVLKGIEGRLCCPDDRDCTSRANRGDP